MSIDTAADYFELRMKEAEKELEQARRERDEALADALIYKSERNGSRQYATIIESQLDKALAAVEEVTNALVCSYMWNSLEEAQKVAEHLCDRLDDMGLLQDHADTIKRAREVRDEE